MRTGRARRAVAALGITATALITAQVAAVATTGVPGGATVVASPATGGGSDIQHG